MEFTAESRNPRPAIKPSGAIFSKEMFDHGRVPPQAVDLEEIVLGSMLLEREALTEVIDIIKPAIFYKESHQKICEAIHTLFRKSEPIDIMTVTNELKNSKNLEAVGGAYYIAQLTNKVASAANIEYHARILVQKHIERELIKSSSDIIKMAYDESIDVFDLLDKAQGGLFELSENNFRRSYVTMDSIVREAVEEIQKARTHTDELRGVPTGFTELDGVTGGLQRSDLIILAARPGMGKTALALTIARNMAVNHKRPVAVFSLEMAAIQLATRLIASESGIPAEKLRKGELTESEWQALTTNIGALAEAPLYLDDTPALSIFELRAKCRRLKEQYDIQFAVIDYLQLMTAGMDKGNREQEISTISRSLKALAKELNIPIMALSQLSRDVEKRGGTKKPVLSDLRESGAIEQDADIVLFVYREQYYNIEDNHKNNEIQEADLRIAKHRNGQIKDLRLKFIPTLATFSDPDPGIGYLNDVSANPSFEEKKKTMTVQSKMNNDTDYSSANTDNLPF
ncbi:MAG: replicative DNA helicase [Bacteroidales bacterium]|nr:replicative DNA helicase [Bacteroidales bacterium]MDD2322547.1 replicative DNA helicase [Bacteroidales bacterium]MDD3009819.1 replicative DNA helicase [Bacteroidales bacterium]MDD3961368.1 replicative DNA helicase [Bacteroidales bacterium]MDY0285209.1 replicative DNA helicase [Bacteroidales bacterium]